MKILLKVSYFLYEQDDFVLLSLNYVSIYICYAYKFFIYYFNYYTRFMIFKVPLVGATLNVDSEEG